MSERKPGPIENLYREREKTRTEAADTVVDGEPTARVQLKQNAVEHLQRLLEAAKKGAQETTGDLKRDHKKKRRAIEKLLKQKNDEKRIEALLLGNLNGIFTDREIEDITEPIGSKTQESSLSRDELLRQMNSAMTQRDTAEVHRLSDLLQSTEPARTITPEPSPRPSGEATEEKPQGPETAKLLSVDARFVEKFGFAAKELQEIPGYAKLTEGQKEMVFENLRQVTLGRIQEEAEEEHKKNTTESKFLGRVWQGISKRYQIAKLERGKFKELESGGIATHGKFLEKLIAGAKEGPEATRNPDGTLEIKFVSEKAYKELVGHDANDREREFIGSLNASITNFAKIPDEWALPSATKKEKKEYEAAKEQYENARHTLIEHMNNGRGGQYALEKAFGLDEKVAMTQFLSSHPNVERELQTINSKTLWVRAFQNVATERGLYFMFGAASRSVAVGLLGAIGAPLAAAGMGGFIAHRRAKETLREDARLARKGSTKMETSNLYRPARDSEGNIIRNLDGSIKQEFAKQVRRESRDYVKADVLAKRIDSLIQKIGASDQKSGIHLKHLDRLIQLTESKLEDGLVNFGKDAQRIENQFTLTKRLGMARAHLFEKKYGHEFHERLDSALAGRNEKISREQKKYMRSQVIRGALLAGAFAGAGRAAAEYFYAGSGRGPVPPEGAKVWEETPAGKEYRAKLWGEVGGSIGREPTEDELNAIAKIQKEGRGKDSMTELLSRMRERPEGVSAHEIEELYGKKAGIAPPETPIAPPDKEAEIGHAMKEATDAEMRGALEFTPEQLRETVKSGDSVWKNAERKLDTLFRDKFSNLDQARQTFVIDAIKDEIADRLKAQGLDPDRLKIGQELDYSGILDNKEKVDSIFARANDLDDAVRESITANKTKIADWAQEHPGERLTSERVEEILRAKPTRPEIPTDYTHDAGPVRHESFYNGVSVAEAEAYGSRESAFFAKLAGLSEHEYRAIHTQSIRHILEQIPSEREARMIWEGQIPGRTINLPHFDQYDPNEFEGHVRLAGLIRRYIEQNPHNAFSLDITVDDFFKVAAPEEGPVFQGAQGPEIFEPEEFAQMESRGARAPIEQTSGKFAEEPFAAEYTPPDQNVGSVLIEGKDIRDFGSAEEAFVAKKQLGMIPREWTDIKSLEGQSLLSQTPEGAAKMNPGELRQWYETAKPKLPAANSFDSFRKQALLADAIRESLKTRSDPEYLKSLSVRELVRIFVLTETGRGNAIEEVIKKAAGFDHGIQAP